MPILNDIKSEFSRTATSLKQGITSQASQLKKDVKGKLQDTGKKTIRQVEQKASGAIQSGAQSVASKIGVKLSPAPTAKPAPTVTAPTIKPSPVQTPAAPFEKAVQAVKENPKTATSAIAGVVVVSALVWYFFLRKK